jgi:hypothetical protein
MPPSDGTRASTRSHGGADQEGRREPSAAPERDAGLQELPPHRGRQRRHEFHRLLRHVGAGRRVDPRRSHLGARGEAGDGTSQSAQGHGRRSDRGENERTRPGLTRSRTFAGGEGPHLRAFSFGPPLRRSRRMSHKSSPSFKVSPGPSWARRRADRMPISRYRTEKGRARGQSRDRRQARRSGSVGEVDRRDRARRQGIP